MDEQQRKKMQEALAARLAGKEMPSGFEASPEDQEAIKEKMMTFKEKFGEPTLASMDESPLAQAMKLAARGGEYTPEEEAFMNEHGQNPFMRGLMQGGGMMGGIQAVKGAAAPAAQAAMAEAKPAFEQLRRMFQAGGKSFEAGSTAEAMKVAEALKKSGQINPGSQLVKLGYKP